MLTRLQVTVFRFHAQLRAYLRAGWIHYYPVGVLHGQPYVPFVRKDHERHRQKVAAAASTCSLT